jgi:ATP-dependent phosphoenolpyruvate carboxykinase
LELAAPYVGRRGRPPSRGNPLRHGGAGGPHGHAHGPLPSGTGSSSSTDTIDFKPNFTVLCAPNCLADPARDGAPSETSVLLKFSKQLVVILGTTCAGEIKKSIFTVVNYLLPQKGILTMHCSANVGAAGDVALFFGLSGTGKTALSANESPSTTRRYGR